MSEILGERQKEIKELKQEVKEFVYKLYCHKEHAGNCLLSSEEIKNLYERNDEVHKRLRELNAK